MSGTYGNSTSSTLHGSRPTAANLFRQKAQQREEDVKNAFQSSQGQSFNPATKVSVDPSVTGCD